MADLQTRLSAALADRYRIERELGHGGMATVFLAHDIRHDRKVALKVLHPEIAASVGTDRFEREIRLAARLQHPHILPVHDSGEVPATPGNPPLLWFTMPRVEGESLRERLVRERQLPIADAVRITREAADALEYAHRHGVIHRDIKPENILLTETHALVADFGIARALAGGAATDLTATGVAIGTPTYMSPEQATGEREIDARTDVYSLGCVLYEMLVGEPPHTGPTAQVIVSRRLTEDPRQARETRPGVPEHLDQALQRALARLPADRFGSTAEFARAIDVPAVPTASMTASAPTRPGSRRGVPLAAVLAVGVLLGTGILFGWRQLQSGGPADDGTAPFLAVLPFENQGDSSDAYFADGITDEVRGKLASLPGFRVIARGSMNQYRATTKPLEQVADELGVRYLLTGTVRWVRTGGGDRVRVSPELVEVTSGRSVSRWQQPFDADLTDVFQIQADIASRVADALDIALAPSAAPVLAEQPTSNLEAYDAYLRGEDSYFRSSGNVAVQQAIEQYQRAVQLDSSFARAWGRLAQALSSAYFATNPSRQTANLALQAAERARTLAPNLPEAHLALGGYYALVVGDQQRAIEALSRGLELAPAHPELLGAMGFAQQGAGRVEEALDYMRRGLAIDPRSLLYVRRLTRLLTWARRYPEATEAARRALAIAPADAAAAHYASLIHVAQGDTASARAILRDVPAGADERARVAYLAGDWGIGPWLLDDHQQQVALGLSAASFGGGRGAWGVAMAGVHAMRGDQTLTRAFADSARADWEDRLLENPGDATTHALLGVSLAYLGRRQEAVREGERGIALAQGRAISVGYVAHTLVAIYMRVGEYEKALGLLDTILKMPYYLSPGWLRVDPLFNPLRGDPRFQALASGG